MKLRIVCLLSAFVLSAGAALAQEYPTKPIRFVIPYAPGGGTDIVARTIGQALTDALGRSVVVDNRPGAGGTIGTAQVAAATPDGYTMLLSGTSMVLAAALYKNLPYDILRDLEPVSLVASQPNLLVVHPSLPVNSVKELVALAKAKPGSITYASGGSGSANHMATELLKLLANIDLTHVPYKGTGPAVTDLLSGQVQLTISVIAATLPHVKIGRLRALAVTSAARSAAAPEIPTLSEAGVKDYEFTTWYGIQMPAKTPVSIINQMNAVTARVVQMPKLRERYAASGLDPRSSTPEEFRALIRSEIAKWAKVVKKAGMTAE